jgi:hypothetical protein
MGMGQTLMHTAQNSTQHNIQLLKSTQVQRLFQHNYTAPISRKSELDIFSAASAVNDNRSTGQFYARRVKRTEQYICFGAKTKEQNDG